MVTAMAVLLGMCNRRDPVRASTSVGSAPHWLVRLSQHVERWPGRFLLGVLCLLSWETSDAAQPLIVAHRGLIRHAPENTLANFRACLELRIGFEFDVGKTKDGHLVCIHDATVDRTTNGSGRVSDMTLKQLRALDAGSWFDPVFLGERIPTIEEVLALVASYRKEHAHRVLVAADLKTQDVGQDVVRIADRLKVLDQVLFIGRPIRDARVRRSIRDASSKSHTAAVANDASEFSRALAAPRANWVYVRFLPSREQVEAVHRANKRVFIAGSSVSGHEPKNWQHSQSVGLDAVLTDFPLGLRSSLRSQKVQSRR